MSREAARVKDPDAGLHALNMVWSLGFEYGLSGHSGMPDISKHGHALQDQYLQGIRDGRRTREGCTILQFPGA